MKRIHTQHYIDADAILAALDDEPVVSIRINAGKSVGKPNDDVVPWCGTGYYLNHRPVFTMDPLFHAGCYYPQEASSMFIEQIFKQLIDKKEVKILDLCAAPGGKSTHIASLMGNGGLLVANEVIRQRVSVLNENITKWGFANTLVTNSDPASFSKLNGYFDIIFVDAPCSGEGMFRDKKVREEWSVNNTLLCAERQKRILSDILPALKEGGLLVYSTCTFNPDENEHNISWLADTGKAETVKLDIAGFQGIEEIQYKNITGYSFQPGKIRGDGFFISVVMKTEEEKKRFGKYGKSRGEPVASGDIKQKVYSLFAVDDAELIKKGDDLIALPCSFSDYCYLSDHLRMVKSGTAVLTMKGGTVVPNHELAMSMKYKSGVFPVLKLDRMSALKYLRRDNIFVGDMPKGRLMVQYDGVNLGFVNNLGNRFNNYYPVDWRIRMAVD